MCIKTHPAVWLTKWLWNSFCQVLKGKLTQQSFLFFFRWFALSGMRAKGRPALCRTWLRTGQSLPCHTTSSSFTSNSKFPNNLQRDFGNRGIQKRVCVRMYVRSQRKIEGLSSCDASPLWGKASEQNCITQIKQSMMERDRTDSDAHLALFLCWIIILEGRKRSHDSGCVE